MTFDQFQKECAEYAERNEKIEAAAKAKNPARFEWDQADKGNMENIGKAPLKVMEIIKANNAKAKPESLSTLAQRASWAVSDAEKAGAPFEEQQLLERIEDLFWDMI